MMMMQHHSDGRAKSPRRVSEPGRRSLSPSSEELRHHQHQLHHQHHQLSSMYASSLAGVPLTGGGPRSLPSGVSRSATATPTGSPKRRHLPQIPSALQQTSFARVRQDVEERARLLKMRMGQSPSVGGGGSGSGSGVRSWRMYSGHSDNDLPPQRSSTSGGGSGGGTWGHHHSQNQQQIYSGVSVGRSGIGSIGRAGRSLSGAASDGGGKSLHSPDRERVNAAGGGGGGDSDVESLVSFVSGTSALSTQSERPAASYVKRVG